MNGSRVHHVLKWPAWTLLISKYYLVYQATPNQVVLWRIKIKFVASMEIYYSPKVLDFSVN